MCGILAALCDTEEQYQTIKVLCDPVRDSEKAIYLQLIAKLNIGNSDQFHYSVQL